MLELTDKITDKYVKELTGKGKNNVVTGEFQ